VTGGGTSVVLDSGRRAAGMHTFTFDGKRPDGSTLPEGGYRFTVSATDDQGRSSTAGRQFALNDTLASLAVAPAQVRITRARRTVLASTFTLASSAKVTATIETRGGIVIRTLAAKSLAAGPQRLTWDGRTALGTLAFGGPYVVHVRATTSVGRVDLTAPFTARRG
jgi:flagellar hook assembly protein FlgD